MKARCWVVRCPEPAKSRGLCQWHYERQHTYRDFAALAGPRHPKPHCSKCGTELRSLNARTCMGCRPEPGTPRDWVNPLVCVCSEPDADPRVNFGECSICRRKPLSLMAVPA